MKDLASRAFAALLLALLALSMLAAIAVLVRVIAWELGL